MATPRTTSESLSIESESATLPSFCARTYQRDGGTGRQESARTAVRFQRAPSWDFSAHTVDLLSELGFEWSSSGMAREFKPYELTEKVAPRDGPYEVGGPVGITEIPVSWQRDDYPALAFSGNRAFSDEAAVFDHWRRQFDWMYDHLDGGVYVMTVHPQVIGRAPRPQMLEELIEHAAGKPGVEFARLGDVT